MQKFIVKYIDQDGNEQTAYVTAETIMDVVEAYEDEGFEVISVHTKEG